MLGVVYTFDIIQDTCISLSINLPKCKYSKIGGNLTCPVCDKDDKVIPIIYGRPSEKSIKEAANGKVKLAGCRLPACPAFKFCKRDQIEF